MRTAMDNNNRSQALKTKKCPYCYTYLTIADEVCFSCKNKVGKVDKYGMAKTPVDWNAYIRALLMWCIFCLFVWWKFFRDKWTSRLSQNRKEQPPFWKYNSPVTDNQIFASDGLVRHPQNLYPVVRPLAWKCLISALMPTGSSKLRNLCCPPTRCAQILECMLNVMDNQLHFRCAITYN